LEQEFIERCPPPGQPLSNSAPTSRMLPLGQSDALGHCGIHSVELSAVDIIDAEKLVFR
jgi:hypothetical protein